MCRTSQSTVVQSYTAAREPGKCGWAVWLNLKNSTNEGKRPGLELSQLAESSLSVYHSPGCDSQHYISWTWWGLCTPRTWQDQKFKVILGASLGYLREASLGYMSPWLKKRHWKVGKQEVTLLSEFISTLCQDCTKTSVKMFKDINLQGQTKWPQMKDRQASHIFQASKLSQAVPGKYVLLDESDFMTIAKHKR